MSWIREIKGLKKRVRFLQLSAVLLLVCVCLFSMNTPKTPKKVLRPITEQYHFAEDPNDLFEIREGIEVQSGLVAKGDWLIVKQTCTGCHSSKLITQNRANAEGWAQMIDWMQETQGLWDLGANEAKVVSYLATYYAPEETGRRRALVVDDWYDIE